jgi:Protein phosphatase 2C
MAGPLLDKNMPAWTWAAASCAGTSHVKANTRRQDSFRCLAAGSGAEIIVAVVSDGAGTASHGGEGAALVSRIISSRAQAHFETSTELPGDEVIWSWVDEVRDVIARTAERLGVKRRAFAATLVCVLSDGEKTVVAHIGDGAAVVQARDGTWSALSWPAHGRYVSMTYFVTDDPLPKLRITRSNVAITAAAVFSDGIERLVLKFESRTAHQPFFNSFITPVRNGDAEGLNQNLSLLLRQYLDSPSVNARTDDDKTLILAALK